MSALSTIAYSALAAMGVGQVTKHQYDQQAKGVEGQMKKEKKRQDDLLAEKKKKDEAIAKGKRDTEARDASAKRQRAARASAQQRGQGAGAVSVAEPGGLGGAKTLLGA